MNKINETLSYTTESPEARFIRLRTDVAVQIDRCREEHGWTQREFAMHLNKQESYVSRLLSGTENLSLKTIAGIEHVFKKSVVKIPWVEQRTSELEMEEIRQLTLAGIDTNPLVATGNSTLNGNGMMNANVWNSQATNSDVTFTQADNILYYKQAA